MLSTTFQLRTAAYLVDHVQLVWVFSLDSLRETMDGLRSCISKTMNHLSLSNTIDSLSVFKQTSQELRMLSSVTLNCQVTMIVMNSGSQLSEL